MTNSAARVVENDVPPKPQAMRQRIASPGASANGVFILFFIMLRDHLGLMHYVRCNKIVGFLYIFVHKMIRLVEQRTLILSKRLKTGRNGRGWHSSCFYNPAQAKCNCTRWLKTEQQRI